VAAAATVIVEPIISNIGGN